MPWARFEDSFPSHRKIVRLSDATFRVHVQAIIWCSRYANDGELTRRELRDVAKPIKSWGLIVKVLVREGLWEEVDGGWKIHDYLDYQPSAAQVASDRAAARERQRRYRANGHAVTNGVTKDLVTRESHDPDPTRPEKEEGLLSNVSSANETGRLPEPPRTCPKHARDPDPPPCGACAEFRREHTRWLQADIERQRAAPRCKHHPHEYAHSCRLCRSERLGAQ